MSFSDAICSNAPLIFKLPEKQAIDAQATVDRETALRARLDATSGERGVLAAQRSAITVPVPGALGPMRKLATDLAAARAALDVGLVVTVTPKALLDIRVQKDGQKAESTSTAQPLDIEAKAGVDIAIADIATVRVRGGRREAQATAKGLETRWSREVAPQLAAAGVTDFEGLDAKIAEAQELDSGIKAKDAELNSLRAQVNALAGAVEALREASDRAAACRALLGDVRLDTLAADLKALGADATSGLRKRRQRLSKEAEEARRIASDATNERTLTDERTRQSKMALDAAIVARDAALMPFPEGVDPALVAARVALAAGVAEKESVAAEFASLERTITERKRRIDTAVSGARTNATQAAAAVGSLLTTRSVLPRIPRLARNQILTASRATSSGRRALSNRLVGRWPASGCAMRPRHLSSQSVRKEKSKRNMRPGDCCSIR